jgi:hypothetical protein
MTTRRLQTPCCATDVSGPTRDDFRTTHVGLTKPLDRTLDVAKSKMETIMAKISLV